MSEKTDMTTAEDAGLSQEPPASPSPVLRDAATAPAPAVSGGEERANCSDCPPLGYEKSARCDECPRAPAPLHEAGLRAAHDAVMEAHDNGDDWDMQMEKAIRAYLAALAAADRSAS